MTTSKCFLEDEDLNSFYSDNDYINRISDYLLSILPVNHPDIITVFKIKDLTRLVTELRKKISKITKSSLTDSLKIIKQEVNDNFKDELKAKVKFLINLLSCKMNERYDLMIDLNRRAQYEGNFNKNSLVCSSSGSF